jgi:hypothetical protein
VQTDCRSACSFYTAGTTDISTEHLIAEVQLPENFGISVEVRLGEIWKSSSHNILQIRDKSNSQQILRISVGAFNNLRMSYGVTTYVTDGGPTLFTNYNETFTTIKFAYAFGQLALQSLAAPATSYYGSITTAPFDTSSKVFQVYASGTAGDYPTAGGTLKNLYIQCKLSVPHLAPLSGGVKRCCLVCECVHSAYAHSKCGSHYCALCGAAHLQALHCAAQLCSHHRLPQRLLLRF